ncbi:MAG: HTTM domain-containing protein [Marinovum sp.]|nr:HTTM domain-containing protein [Marinovum sp.]
MSLDNALRWTECLLAFALLLQSIEHLARPRASVETLLFGLRLGLCALAMPGIAGPWAIWGLWLTSIMLLWRYDGPYNGGADRMGLLVLTMVSVALAWPAHAGLAMGYLAVQVTLSYFVSGWVKLRNPNWRDGTALANVFRFSAYPVSDDLRALAHRPGLLFCAGWAVILLEVFFPLAILHRNLLALALGATATFHFVNAVVFGLNRFFWVWLSGYPALFWLQERLSLLY